MLNIKNIFVVLIRYFYNFFFIKGGRKKGREEGREGERDGEKKKGRKEGKIVKKVDIFW